MHKKQQVIIGLLAIALIVIPAMVFISNQQQEIRSGAWYTSQSANTSCDAANGAIIAVQFSNTEPNKPSLSMNVIATDQQTSKSVNMGSIAGGQTKINNIQTEKTTLSAGSVVYKLTWTDGNSGIDSRIATYKAISNCNTIPTPTPNLTSTPTTKPTCIPRPACLDEEPHCLIPETSDMCPKSTPTPTVTPHLTPSLTPTLEPTTTPTPTPVSTTLLIKGLLDGIGSRGDNSNPDGSLSNKNPLHPTRNIKLNIFSAANQLVATSTGTINYSSTSGMFNGSIILAQAIPSDNYTIKAVTDNHLTRLLPGILQLIVGQENALPNAVFIAGDIIEDNKLDILDYNSLIDCYSDLLPATACENVQKKNASDLNDDSSVNQFDYNLFLREIATQPGQ